MTDAIEFDESGQPPPPSPLALALRQKIGWLCQIIRGMGVIWALWLLYAIVKFWGDPAKVSAVYGKSFNFDPTTIEASHYYGAYGLHIAAWALAAWVAAALWRLFSRYLAGEIFTVPAALGLRHLGLVGAGAEAFDLLQRPIVFALMTAGHDVGGRSGWFFHPGDLLNIIFVTFLFSLAYIFKTAAELADEHAQIV
jgi:hypothetical protein